MINIFNIKLLISILVSFLSATIISPFLIPILHKLKFGQSILEIGPKWHKKKNGTPTMGGIIFIFGGLLGIFSTVILLSEKSGLGTFLLLLCSLGFGLVGFIDDYIKVVKKQNLGLKAWQKLALQLIFCVLFLVIAIYKEVISTDIIIPFCSIKLSLPIFIYIPAIIFVLLGTVNSVNLTDGIDGLATTLTIIVMFFFAIIVKSDSSRIFALSIAGGLLGFLIFNKHPAKVFMGDTGSLFLGGAVGALAVMEENPLILIIVGFVYMFESISVMIQVAHFKRTKKRVFKMTPIHHHFEMCGWSEVKIVTVFSLVTLFLCVIGYLSI